jgi:hypothetical protein
MKQLLATLAVLTLIDLPLRGAGPRVDVVTGPDAPRLERFAAAELAGQFKQLFDAEVHLSHKIPPQSGHLILLGSPATNPAVKAAAGDRWPMLSDQGHLVRSVTWDGRKVLVVGGGSPVATLWAVYELGHHFGLRSLLHGDLLPATTPALKLDGIELAMEPTLRVRAWQALRPADIGFESWGLSDQKRIVRQLAKLKFNRVVVYLSPDWPVYRLEFRGRAKQTASFTARIAVSGDTAGKDAFKGAEVFENPDFSGKKSYEEKTAAGIALVSGILDAAQDLGMSTAIAMNPVEFPGEFATELKGKPVKDGQATATPDPSLGPDDPILRNLAAAQLRAVIGTYPKAEAIYFAASGVDDWASKQFEGAWKRLSARMNLGNVAAAGQLFQMVRSKEDFLGSSRVKTTIAVLDLFWNIVDHQKILERPGGKTCELCIAGDHPALAPLVDKLLPAGAGVLRYSAEFSADKDDVARSRPPRTIPAIETVILADSTPGALPHMAIASTAKHLIRLGKDGWDGFVVLAPPIPGDLDMAVHFLSRAAFDPALTPQASADDLVAPSCGEGVAPRVAKAFGMVEEVNRLPGENDGRFSGMTSRDILQKHYRSGQAPPAGLKKARDFYSGAMDEMYRALTRSGPRPFLFYHAKRLEFAVLYLNCVEALHLAGQAKAKGEHEKQLEQLEKAVEALHDALSCMGEVARDPSDRGVIAVLNEYGYRPLKSELEKVEKTAKKGP